MHFVQAINFGRPKPNPQKETAAALLPNREHRKKSISGVPRRIRWSVSLADPIKTTASNHIMILSMWRAFQNEG